MAEQPLVGQGLLIIEASRSHSDTPNSVWMSDQPDADTSTCQHTTLIRDRQPCHAAGFEPAIPATEGPAADPILRTRGHWDQPLIYNIEYKLNTLLGTDI
jgi:hypothetical protein